MEILALIPARGGSKSIPRKNIKPLAGYPLIAYSIAAAMQSRLVTRTIVSTDDDEIACTAQSYGAEAPFLRPAEFARDDTTDLPVFTHALQLAQGEGRLPAGYRGAASTHLTHPPTRLCRPGGADPARSSRS